MGLRIFVTTVWVVVTASVIAGLILSGSPGRTRSARLDAQKISDLSQISAGIDAFFAAHDRLPESLEELQTERNLAIRSIHDPHGTPYTYRVVEDRVYELCAVFETDSSRTPVPGGLSRGHFWNHPAGEHCFTLEPEEIPPTRRRSF